MSATFQNKTYLPPMQEASSARHDFEDHDEYVQVARALQNYSGHSSAIVIDGQEFDLPRTAVEILAQVAMALGENQGISILRHDIELSTQEAADFLGISRPTLVRMCEDGTIPYRKIHRHRKLQLRDVVQYRARQQRRSAETLDDMVADSQFLEDYDYDSSSVNKLIKEIRHEK